MTAHTDHQPTRLGEPLAVFQDTALCDRHSHEVVLVSDGQRAYVFPVEGEVVGETTVARVGATLSATCPLLVSEEQCDGHLAWRLDTEAWTYSADSRRLLVAYGRGVEQ